MKPLLLALMTLHALPMAGAIAADYNWHAVEWRQDRIEYGVPETDNRLLGLECTAAGRVVLWGPIPGSNWEFSDGREVTVSLRAGSLKRYVRGHMGEAGNGINFVVMLSPKSPFLAQLRSGKSLEIAHSGNRYQITGRGGETLIEKLLSACQKGGL